jgi:hypothetical protein
VRTFSAFFVELCGRIPTAQMVERPLFLSCTNSNLSLVTIAPVWAAREMPPDAFAGWYPRIASSASRGVVYGVLGKGTSGSIWISGLAPT